MPRRTRAGLALAGLLAVAATVAIGPSPAGAVEVATGADFTAAFVDPAVTEVVLTADIELGCEGANRAGNPPPIVVDGGGHTIVVTCPTGGGTVQALGPLTVRDLEVLGPEAEFASALRGNEMELERVHLVGRNDAAVLFTGGATTVSDSTIEVATFGRAIDAIGGTLVVTGTTITGPGSGIDHRPSGSEPGTGLVVRDTRIDVDLRALAATRSGVVERSSLHGGQRSLTFAGQRLVVTDTTIVADVGFADAGTSGAALTVGRGSAVRLDHVTIPSVAAVALQDSIGFVDETGAVVLAATVVEAPTGRWACTGPGTVTSDGDNAIGDTSCFSSTPGDEVGTDTGLEPFDPALGYAAPVAGGPLVDDVADCRTATDQRGLARPQGTACDVGAVELEADTVPPSTSTTTTVAGGGPGSPAAPATPVVAPARFTG